MLDMLVAFRLASNSLRRDRRGAVAIMFGLVAVPLVMFAGMAIDYAQLVRIRIMLNGAADSAVLATVATQSATYTAATQMPQDGTIAQGAADAVSLFNAEIANRVGFSITGVTAAANKSNGTVNATLQYSAQVPTAFMKVAGISTMTTSGTASASNGLVIYIDFYLLLDNSPSMGLGATPADITNLEQVTQAQPPLHELCAFACHDLSGYEDYYTLAHQNGITMRIDVLRTATQQLMTTAAQTERVPSQFRMAIYTFSQTVATITDLTDDLNGAASAASAIDLIPVPYQNYDQDQYTDYVTAMTTMNSDIPNPGAGDSAQTPQKVLFFVTDGVADYAGPNGRTIEPIDLSLCSAIKSRGIQIAVLYTTYLPVINNSFYMTYVDPFHPNIGPTMQSCASPGLYFEVSPSEGIADAMRALFMRVVTQAHLTQ